MADLIDLSRFRIEFMTGGALFKDKMTDLIDFNMIRREFFAGGTAGGIGVFLGFPLDFIKVNLQTHPEKYGSAWQCFKQKIENEGFRSLYRGCVPPIMMQGLTNSLVFTGESLATKVLEPNLKPGETASPLHSFMAGSAGGLLQCVVSVPAEVIKCSMQAGSIPSYKIAGQTFAGKKLDTFGTIKYTYKTEGIRGMYKGLGVTLMREIPAIGIYFFTYKNLRKQFHAMQGGTAQTTFSTPATMTAGAFAGAASCVVLYPLDVIKSNIQASRKGGMTNSTSAGTKAMHAAEVSGGIVPFKDMGFWSVGKRLYKSRGAGTFYKGVGVAVARAMPVNAVIFLLYEKVKVVAFEPLAT